MKNNGAYTVAEGYPKPNSAWNFNAGAPDLNQKVSAATLYQNKVYFFTKKDYYRYKDQFDAVWRLPWKDFSLFFLKKFRNNCVVVYTKL